MSDRNALVPGCGAVLFTRAWPNRAIVDGFDEWQQRRHFPDLVALPGVRRADYYRTLEDPLPQLVRGSGSRIAAYWSSGLDDLFTFLTDPRLAEAVADGSRFFPGFNELDGDTYTGNIYALDDVEVGAAGVGDAQPLLLVERFEVGGCADDFDRWLRDEHVPALLAVPSIAGVRIGRAVREDLPIPYYNSVGDRVVLVAVDGDVGDLAADNALLDAVADTQRWDRRLQYVRREVAAPVFHRASPAQP